MSLKYGGLTVETVPAAAPRIPKVPTDRINPYSKAARRMTDRVLSSVQISDVRIVPTFNSSI
jgi:hypothetical protein